MLTNAASRPPVPAHGNTRASFLVWKAHCRPSRHSRMSSANAGPRWLIMGTAIASSTRRGTGVGPGTRNWKLIALAILPGPRALRPQLHEGRGTLVEPLLAGVELDGRAGRLAEHQCEH